MGAGQQIKIVSTIVIQNHHKRLKIVSGIVIGTKDKEPKSV